MSLHYPTMHEPINWPLRTEAAGELLCCATFEKFHFISWQFSLKRARIPVDKHNSAVERWTLETFPFSLQLWCLCRKCAWSLLRKLWQSKLESFTKIFNQLQRSGAKIIGLSSRITYSTSIADPNSVNKFDLKESKRSYPLLKMIYWPVAKRDL